MTDANTPPANFEIVDNRSTIFKFAIGICLIAVLLGLSILQFHRDVSDRHERLLSSIDAEGLVIDDAQAITVTKGDGRIHVQMTVLQQAGKGRTAEVFVFTVPTATFDVDIRASREVPWTSVTWSRTSLPIVRSVPKSPGTPSTWTS